jgi:hypothetical protein
VVESSAHLHRTRRRCGDFGGGRARRADRGGRLPTSLWSLSDQVDQALPLKLGLNVLPVTTGKTDQIDAIALAAIAFDLEGRLPVVVARTAHKSVGTDPHAAECFGDSAGAHRLPPFTIEIF